MRSKMYSLLMAVLVLPLASFAKESLPDYTVGKASIDKTLKPGESVYVLTFTDYGTPMKGKTVVLSYNGVEKKLAMNANGTCSLKVKAGRYKFQFYVQDYYEITTDSIAVKSGYRLPVEVNMMSAARPVMVEKPVVYVYAPEQTAVSMKLEPKGGFNFTYPAYQDGWNFTTGPDGTLSMDGKHYPYLFWDAQMTFDLHTINLKEGFVVSKEDMIPFFEDKLKAMGMNAKESTDFITYWCPRMSENRACYIHFLFNEAFESYAPMSVEPKPDHIFRVCMLWSPADERAEMSRLKEQEIPAISRNGLSIVEWGGSEIQLFHP